MDRLRRRADRVLLGDREDVHERARGAARAQHRAHRHPLAFGEGPRGQEALAVALRVGDRAPAVDPGSRARHADRRDLARGTPRRLIWVWGEASRLPGSGETVTAPPSSAELLSVAGVHGGGGPAAGAAP